MRPNKRVYKIDFPQLPFSEWGRWLSSCNIFFSNEELSLDSYSHTRTNGVYIYYLRTHIARWEVETEDSFGDNGSTSLCMPQWTVGSCHKLGGRQASQYCHNLLTSSHGLRYTFPTLTGAEKCRNTHKHAHTWACTFITQHPSKWINTKLHNE